MLGGGMAFAARETPTRSPSARRGVRASFKAAEPGRLKQVLLSFASWAAPRHVRCQSLLNGCLPGLLGRRGIVCGTT